MAFEITLYAIYIFYIIEKDIQLCINKNNIFMV